VTSAVSEPPQAGEVFRYPYLWRRQDQAGETEGRKRRPSCVAAVATESEGRTLLFILALTTSPPSSDRLTLAVPETEARRAGLKAAASWVILDEVNVDILERSFSFEDRTPLGRFSPGFTRQVQSDLREARRAARLGVVGRG
jgi:hypothetical protein